MSYIDKLKHPKWQRKRLEVFERDGWTCLSCGNDEDPLHVHHKEYKNYDPWDVDMDLLETRCENCHEGYHQEAKWYRGDY